MQIITEFPCDVVETPDMEIVLSQQDNTMRLPTEAIFAQNQVLVVGKDNVLQARSVSTGISNWRWTQIQAGLNTGERVLLSLDTPGAVIGARVNFTDSNSDRHD